MYQCELCGETSAPGEQAHHVIVETREVSYARRSHSQPPGRRKDRTKRKLWGSDPGGEGAEIVNEAIACSVCADRIEQRRLDRARAEADAFESDAFAEDAFEGDAFDGTGHAEAASA